MRATRLTACVIGLCTIFVLQAVNAQGTSAKQAQVNKKKEAKQMLNSMVGSWEGTCRTWFQPGKLADESSVKGDITPMLGGKFVRHATNSMEHVFRTDCAHQPSQ